MKKLLALVLAAAMVLALVPMTAMAATTVSTEADLEAAAAAGGEVALGADIALSKSLNVTKTLTIDLNGKTISKASTWSSGDSLIVVKNGGKLTINGTGAIDGSGLMVGIKLGDASENSLASRTYELNINGGTVTGDSYGISGNGYRHGSKVTITGGKVQGDGAGIFQPQDGVLNIKGTAVVEGGCGVEIRAGEINVSENALIQATDDYAAPVANGSGMTMQGVALAVSPHDTGKDLKVNITGGTFEATGSNGLSFCENDTTAAGSSEKVTLSVSGGTFLKGFETENFNTDDRGGYVTGGIHHVDLYDTMVDPNTLIAIEDEASPIGYVGNAAKTRLANAPANTALVVVQAKAGAELAVAPGVILTNDSGVTIKVNGKTLSDDTLYTVPGISAEPIPETGDGMGLFVFAGLALISMLGMVAMKKREEY